MGAVPTEQTGHAAPRHNLPASLTRFVGRQALLTEIAARLEDPLCRLLTLVGPGGIGKTRLAIEAARGQVGRYDGVFFVALASLPSADAIVPTIIQAIGLGSSGGTDPQAQLTNYLRRRHVLLVVDNYEHLLPDVEVVLDILKAVPEVVILATSRARLNVQGEHLVLVPGMKTPTIKGKDVAQHSAVQLFLQSAKRVRPGLDPDEEGLAHVARICRIVDGIPLAILLAASWADVLALREIGDQLELGIGLLETDLRDVPERQRSMGAVLNASWEMLTGAERDAFARASVFRGGFTVEAAQAVAEADVRALRGLVRKSFLQVEPSGRYQVHELLRQYAAAKLAQRPGEPERSADLHSSYYCGFLERNVDEFRNPGSRDTLVEIDNVRAAWDWALERRSLADIRRSLMGLYWFDESPNWDRECSSLARRAVDALRVAAPTRKNRVALGLALCFYGCLYQDADRRDRAGAIALHGLNLLREIGAWRELATCNNMAMRYLEIWDPAEGEQLLRENLFTCEKAGAHFDLVWTLYLLSIAAIGKRSYQELPAYKEQTLTICRQIDYPYGMAIQVGTMGHAAFAQGQYAEAKQCYEESLALLRQLSARQWIAWRLVSLADLALAMGDYGEAERHYREGLARSEELGDDHTVAWAVCGLGNVALATGNPAQARRSHRRGFAGPLDHPVVFIAVLASLARLVAYQGDRERAVELVALALAHTSGVPGPFFGALRYQEELRASLPPEVYTAAVERGRTRDLQITLRELHAELGIEG
jgi:predicted ATPase